MITNALPDIPRLYTAIAEWGACLVFALLFQGAVPKRRLALLIPGGLAVLVTIQFTAGKAPTSVWILGMAAAAIAVFALVMALTGTRAREAIFLATHAFILAELVASLQWQLAAFFRPGTASWADPWTILLLVVIDGACFGLAWALERRHFPPGESFEVTRSSTWSAVVIAGATFALSNLSFVSTTTPFSGSVGPEVFYIRTLVDLCGLVILYSQHEQIREVRTSAELASINATLRSQHDQYLQSKANVEAAARAYHDLHHQIEVIRAQVDPARASEHFEELEASVRSIGAQVHTGNPVLDVILTSKTRLCAGQGITLTAVADGSLLSGMSAMDIATLFGNALDNAIEAVSRIAEPEERLIRLALFSQGQMAVLRVENRFEGKLNADRSGKLLTTKSDTTHHGIGLTSIRFAAASYDGVVTTSAKDQWFTLSVLIPSAPSALSSN